MIRNVKMSEKLFCNFSDSNIQRIRKKYLECWKIYATHKLVRQRALRKAIYLYNVRLKQKVLNAFLKNCITAKGVQTHYKTPSTNLNIVHPVFQRARELEREHFLKRAYHVWSVYTKNRQRRKVSKARISALRNEELCKYIQIWRVLCLTKKRNVELEKQAIEFHRYILLRKFLRLWRESHSQIILQRTKIKMAIVHYHGKLLSKVWFTWIKYCNIKISKLNKTEESRKFYNRKLFTKSFKLLSLNVFATIEKRETLEKATNYYANRLLSRIFHTWITYQRERIKYKYLVRIQRRNMENSLKKNALGQWRLYVWRKKCGRRKINISTSHYNKKLATKGVTSLKNYLTYRIAKNIDLSRLEKGKAQISSDKLRVYVNKWRIAVIRVAQERQKYRRAEDHWSSRQLERYFIIWKLFSEGYKLQAKRKETLNEIGKIVLLSKYTSLWCKKYEIIARIRDKEKRALSVYETKVQLRFFRSWKRYREEKIARILEIEEAEKFHRKMLLREGLRETLKMCLYKSEKRYEQRLRLTRKNTIEDFEIMRKFFDKWMIFVSDDNRKASKRLPEVNNKIYEFSCLPTSTRLVLPEYMLKAMPLEMQDNCNIYKRNCLKDTCNNFGLEKTCQSSSIICVPTPASSSSTSEKSANFSTKTYSIR